MDSFDFLKHMPDVLDIDNRVKYYYLEADKAFDSDISKKESLNLIKGLQKLLNVEMKKYNTNVVEDAVKDNEVAKSYVDCIENASRSLVGNVNYKNMHSVAYDIKDYVYGDYIRRSIISNELNSEN